MNKYADALISVFELYNLHFVTWWLICHFYTNFCIYKKVFFKYG